MFNSEENIKKWQPLLDLEEAAPIKDSYRRAVVAQLLENTEREVAKEHAAKSNFLSEMLLPLPPVVMFRGVLHTVIPFWSVWFAERCPSWSHMTSVVFSR